MYADDTQLYITLDPGDTSESLQKLEKCIEEIKIWMQQNYLKLNNEKTEFIIFGSCSNLKKLGDVSITVGDNKILPSKAVRNLGVIYDPALKMEEHINSISRTANMYLYNIGRIRKFVSPEACKTIVHAFITSRLDYANSLLYGLPKYMINKLQRIQNNAARLITRTPRRDHISPVLKRLHWLPIQERIQFKLLSLTYKAIHNQAPIYLKEMMTEQKPNRPLRSEDDNRLQVKKYKTRFGDRTFTASSAKLWNNLPKDLRNKSTLQTFKKHLKTFLFK